MTEKNDIISTVCNLLLKGNQDEARKSITAHYPFVKPASSKRNYSPFQACQIFLRDGFWDRYSGKKLLFPPVLRVISKCFPSEFPFHPNWKMNECHIAYWELSATIDHVLPVARGGSLDFSNCVTTSMLRNSAKANFTISELGWKVLAPGDLKKWDGMVAWFLRYVEGNPSLRKESYFRIWTSALERAMKRAAKI